MIKKLPKWWWWPSSSRLLSIYGIQCLIHKLAEDTEEIYPLRDSHCETQVVIHVGQRSNDVYHQPSQCDQVWRYALQRWLIFLCVSYERDQLDKEFPPVVEDLVKERIAPWDVLIVFEVFQTLFGNETHNLKINNFDIIIEFNAQ